MAGPAAHPENVKENEKENDNPGNNNPEAPPHSGSGFCRFLRRTLGFGILGYVSGYTIKKVGKFVIVLVGGTVVALEVLGYHEYVRRGYDTAVEHGPSVGATLWEKTKQFLAFTLHHVPDYIGFFAGLTYAIL